LSVLTEVLDDILSGRLVSYMPGRFDSGPNRQSWKAEQPSTCESITAPATLP
jgi:hypothetical protein